MATRRGERSTAGGAPDDMNDDLEDGLGGGNIIAVPILQGIVREYDAYKARIIAAACVFFVALILLSLRIVPPAHVGVVVVFGSVQREVLHSGLNLCNPLAAVTNFNTKTQLLYTENIVPTSEGMNVELDVAILYHADPAKVRELFLTVGVDYENILIKPEMQSAVRGLTSEVSAKALYTSGRAEIRDKLMDELKMKLKPRGIQVEDVLLKGIKLPKMLTDAIEVKAQAEQDSQRMEFVLTKESKEAERKNTDAEGVASFQRIVSDGISSNLLAWKGIEATEKLAQSDNAKIVVMGNTKTSLPVLLSADTGEGKLSNAISGTGDSSKKPSRSMGEVSEFGGDEKKEDGARRR